MKEGVQQETQDDSGQPKVGPCQRFFLVSLKNSLSAEDREVKVRSTAARRERDVTADRQTAGEATHLSASPVMHHLSILSKKKHQRGG